METPLFRGKSDKGWIYGNLTSDTSINNIEVPKESIGMYAHKEDIDGLVIFTGDLAFDGKTTAEISFRNGSFWWGNRLMSRMRRLKVIGNAYDNKCAARMELYKIVRTACAEFNVRPEELHIARKNGVKDTNKVITKILSEVHTHESIAEILNTKRSTVTHRLISFNELYKFNRPFRTKADSVMKKLLYE